MGRRQHSALVFIRLSDGHSAPRRLSSLQHPPSEGDRFAVERNDKAGAYPVKENCSVKWGWQSTTMPSDFYRNIIALLCATEWLLAEVVIPSERNSQAQPPR